jgi:acyl-CoA thioesterase
MAFDDDTALRPLGNGAFEGEIIETWWTPLGPLGGFVMALALRGLVLAVDDEGRAPRSLTMHFLRPPKAGPITVAPRIERAGRSLTTASARLDQEGATVALALAAFSAPWPGPLLSDAPAPQVDPPGDRDAPPGQLGGTTPPPFRAHLSMQRRFGEPPFTEADHAETGGWLGLREERPLDAPAVALLADAWYPAPWQRLPALAPAPTVEMTVHFRAPLPLADGLLLARFRTRLVRDGFFDEDGELWSRDGTLVAQSRQLGLLLGAQ